MTAPVLHASAGKPAQAIPACPAPAVAEKPLAAPARATLCPECLTPFRPGSYQQLFCSPQHKAAWHNRATVRGRVLTPLVMAARATRGGSRGDMGSGRQARQDAEQLMDRWAAEDRAAGRMPAVDYVALRIRKGVMS